MNIEQSRAIEASFDQPLCVLAGPGSGKTKTLVERVIHLIRKISLPCGSSLATIQPSQSVYPGM
jgi:superfamily I DNA/RNA helicase